MATSTGSRELDRVTAFTDAAVAIALTLLVLPLVDLARESGPTPVGQLWRDHAGDLLAFILSFFIVATFWRVHRRIFESLQGIDSGLLLLNLLWLLGVVFLPVPTAVLTFEVGAGNGATVLYLANLLYVSVLSTGLGSWAAARPELLRPDARPHQHPWRGATATAIIAVATGLAVPFGTVALWLLAGVPLAGQAVDRLTGRRAP